MSEGAHKEVVAVDEDPGPLPDHDTMTLEELARAEGKRPFTVADFARFDLFQSDDEVEEFIAYTYAARRRDMA